MSLEDRCYTNMKNVEKLQEQFRGIEDKHKAIAEIISKYGDNINRIVERTKFNRRVPFKKLHPDAVAPKYYSDGAVAFDLHPLITEGDVIRVEPHSQKIIPTGLAFSVPDGFELRISPRSGQSAKQQISIRNSPGIIDSDYRGEIMVIFVNNKDTVHVITKDQRVCQVKLSKAYRADFEEVDELDETERGEGRFGSTGNI